MFIVRQSSSNLSFSRPFTNHCCKPGSEFGRKETDMDGRVSYEGKESICLDLLKHE